MRAMLSPLSFLLIALCAVFAVAAPVPAPVESTSQAPHFVVSPHITKPTQGAHWPTGSRQIVAWDTDKLPAERQASTGLILLGYWTPGEVDEHLDVDHPLAKGFNLADGMVEVTVPEEVACSDNCFIVLFGDSGNTSPTFTIEEESTPKGSLVKALSDILSP
ncbi:hypothetical protein BKA70DRAFT_1184403 [Coprinopsis sp. MPI-PUGE-AT-0042]|nr:hypothetical protein BKA70DRAFT_1184403 [Coprinopsis sp. MPI-PUGE-AT-0042]